jgi:uncharacterized BrkB/YihY/UPF0761 family membrane protein
MADFSRVGSDKAVTFMVAAGLVYEIIAAACSSPQTTEINANSRADTLMKWVIIGLIQAGVFVLIAAAMDDNKWPALLGGGMAAAIMWASYAHAKSAGLKNNAPGTEY